MIRAPVWCRVISTWVIAPPTPLAASRNRNPKAFRQNSIALPESLTVNYGVTEGMDGCLPDTGFSTIVFASISALLRKRGTRNRLEQHIGRQSYLTTRYTFVN